MTDIDGVAISRPPPYYCGEWHAKSNRINGAPEHFLNVYTWSSAPATVFEEVGSEHTLGAAVKFGTGPWTAEVGAEKTTKDSNGGDFTTSSSKRIYNQVNYRYYVRSCWSAGGAFSGNQMAWEQTSFYALTPGALATSVSHLPFAYCAGYVATQHAWKTHGQNVTYHAGVDLGFISVSAQAAFSTDTKIEYVFSRNSQFCGSRSSGPATSPQVDSHSSTETCHTASTAYVDDESGAEYTIGPDGGVVYC
jgi:hypothetical protein